MIILIKSLPDSPQGKRGLKIARDGAADIVLLQDGIYFALNDMIEGFCGTAYAIQDNVEMRGIGDKMRGIKVIDWDALVDMMIKEDKVLGAF